MNTFKLFFSTLFISLITLSFAGNNPEFVVEENGDNYSMYVKISDVSSVNKITVETTYSLNGIETTENIEIDANNINESLAKIQDISTDFDYANYTVLITDNDGLTLAYPMVQVDLNSTTENFASAN